MSDSPHVRAALAVMHAHLAALNARDEAALAATLHFPHHRLSEGRLTTWDGPDAYFSDFRQRAGQHWGHSQWGSLTPVHESPDKVHLSVRVDRFRADGSPLASFWSLWVIARIDGRWAAQLRSTFAEDTALGSSHPDEPSAKI